MAMNEPIGGGMKAIWSSVCGGSMNRAKATLGVTQHMFNEGKSLRQMAIKGGIGIGIGAAGGIGTSYATGDDHMGRDALIGGTVGGLIGAGWAGRKEMGAQWSSIRAGQKDLAEAKAVAGVGAVPVPSARPAAGPALGTRANPRPDSSWDVRSGKAIPTTGNVWSGESDGVADFARSPNSTTGSSYQMKGQAPITTFKQQQFDASWMGRANR